MSFKMELLPAPERPVRNTNSPGSTCNDTSRSASRPFGYRLETRSKRIMAKVCLSDRRAVDERTGEGGRVELREVPRLLAESHEPDG